MYTEGKKNCNPGAINYYNYHTKPPPHFCASWTVKPPVKKPKKKVKTTPACLRSTNYYINLWKE